MKKRREGGKRHLLRLLWGRKERGGRKNMLGI